MKIIDFLGLVSEMMEGQEITGQIAEEAKNENRELTQQEKEQFKRLFAIEYEVRQWLPRFINGISCRNCIERDECDDFCCPSCFEPRELTKF